MWRCMDAVLNGMHGWSQHMCAAGKAQSITWAAHPAGSSTLCMCNLVRRACSHRCAAFCCLVFLQGLNAGAAGQPTAAAAGTPNRFSSKSYTATGAPVLSLPACMHGCPAGVLPVPGAWLLRLHRAQCVLPTLSCQRSLCSQVLLPTHRACHRSALSPGSWTSARCSQQNMQSRTSRHR